MSAFRMAASVALAVFAVACSRSEQSHDRALDPALMSDLESASAPTAALASRSFDRTQVVSAIELGEPVGASTHDHSAAPAKRAAPRVAAAAPKVKAVELEPRIEAAPQPVVVAASAPAAEPAAEPAAAPAPVATPTAGPRPTPNPVNFPEPTGRMPMPGRSGGGIGTIGGVIIRGGSIGDDDHCERHPRGGTRVIFDSPVAVVRPTFPRGAW